MLAGRIGPSAGFGGPLPDCARPDDHLVHLKGERSDEVMISSDVSDDASEPSAGWKPGQVQHAATPCTDNVNVEDGVVSNTLKKDYAVAARTQNVASDIGNSAEDRQLRSGLEHSRSHGTIL